jgi:hypothetical protein
VLYRFLLFVLQILNECELFIGYFVLFCFILSSTAVDTVQTVDLAVIMQTTQHPDLAIHLLAIFTNSRG